MAALRPVTMRAIVNENNVIKSKERGEMKKKKKKMKMKMKMKINTKILKNKKWFKELAYTLPLQRDRTDGTYVSLLKT